MPRKPKMKKMFDGRNMATRPIPVIVDESERRAIAAAASDSKPLGDVVQMPSGPRAKAGGTGVLGKPVRGGAKVNGGVYNPIGVDGNR